MISDNFLTMILYIDTTGAQEIVLELRRPLTKRTRLIASESGPAASELIARRLIKAPRSQGEKLLPALDRLLSQHKLKLREIKKIIVANRGGSFTSLRIGVVTANALAYALNIPVLAADVTGQSQSAPLKKFGRHVLVEPIYNRPPQVGP